MYADSRVVPDGWPLESAKGLLALAAAVAGLVLVMRRRPKGDGLRRVAPFAAFWFLAAFVPVSGIFGAVGDNAIAPRYSYVPAMGLAALFAWGAAALSGRFAELMASGLPADRLYGLWTRYFYDVIGDLGALRSYLDSGRALKKALSDPSDVEMMRVYELDAAFVLSDYDGVLALLDQGIPDHDAPWHEMMRTKVLAHRAEAEGEWAKAAELFTKFVSLLPEEDQTDPTSGVVFTKTLLSANNHKRAGDLWTKAGDAARAAAAYAVARAAYDKALEDNRAGRETADYIEAQRKALDKE